MGQPAPACCVCLATSVLAQVVYLGLIVLCFAASVALGVANAADDGDDVLETVIFVTILVTAIIMSASRICAPCCYEGLEEAGQCCPCSCFLHLDTPLYVMVGLPFFFETLAAEARTHEHAEIKSLRYIRLVGLVGLPYLASVICAMVKLCIMDQLCCQSCLPKVQSAIVSPPQGGHVDISQTVIGRPVPGGAGMMQI